MRTIELNRVDGGVDSFICKKPDEFTPVVLDVADYKTKKKKNRKTGEMRQTDIYNFFMTFDIESTTITPDEFIQYEKKRQEYKEKFGRTIGIPATIPRPYAFMYHWQSKIDDEIVYGHKWDEVFDYFERIRNHLKLNKDRRLICYIHNLGFESWWMLPYIKQRYKDLELFATAPKKPLKMFIPSLGIEFRCSQRLSNMSLYYATKTEKGVQHIKAKGDLDYKALHLPSQELNNSEFAYTIIDVVGLYEYVENRLINEGDDLFSIPLTSTGYVRRFVRKKCMADKNYRRIFLNTRLDADILLMLYDASRGGNTHSNPAMTNRVLHGLDSFDAVSEYPYVLVCKQYPMSQFQYYGVVGSMKELEYLINTYACLFTAVFKNLRLKKDVPVAYLSYANQKGVCGDVRFDNGRVLSVGDKKRAQDGAIAFTITDVDYKLIRDMYEWDELAIANMNIAEYGYLPQPIIDAIMELFIEKCQLKIDINRCKDALKLDPNCAKLIDQLAELKYLYGKCKNRLNGIFGMMYTRPIHGEVYLDENFEYKEVDLSIGDIKEKLNDYYDNWNSFLNYAWGVWCTSWARAHLDRLVRATNYTDPSGQEEKSNVFVYCDTDSSKCIINNYAVIDALNAEIRAECEARGAYADVEGKRFYLGVFERETSDENMYTEFKTLGAKKYVYRDNEGLHTTIAGVNKEKAPAELGEVDNFKVGFTFYDAGGKTLFYNVREPETIEVSGEPIEISNNIAMIDSTYSVNLTMDYSVLLCEYELEEEYEI